MIPARNRARLTFWCRKFFIPQSGMTFFLAEQVARLKGLRCLRESAAGFRIWMCDLLGKVMPNLFENMRVFILEPGKEFL